MTLFVASRPVTIPRIDLVGVDVRVVAFAALLSIATGIVFGLVPALRASTPDLLSALKQTGRGGGLAPSRRFRSALVVVEVAMALVLLVGAGLMIRSFARLMAIEPGFDPDGVVTMRLTLPPAKYREQERWTAFHDELVRRVSGIAGVTAAGVNSAVPLEGGGAESGVLVEGRPLPPPGTQGDMCLFQASSPDYFRAMGIPAGPRPAVQRARHARIDAGRDRRRLAGVAALSRRGPARTAHRVRVPRRSPESESDLEGNRRRRRPRPALRHRVGAALRPALHAVRSVAAVVRAAAAVDGAVRAHAAGRRKR